MLSLNGRPPAQQNDSYTRQLIALQPARRDGCPMLPVCGQIHGLPVSPLRARKTMLISRQQRVPRSVSALKVALRLRSTRSLQRHASSSMVRSSCPLFQTKTVSHASVITPAQHRHHYPLLRPHQYHHHRRRHHTLRLGIHSLVWATAGETILSSRTRCGIILDTATSQMRHGATTTCSTSIPSIAVAGRRKWTHGHR